MAQEQRDRLKEILFFAFVAISLVLVVLVWTNGLQADADVVPGYYRNSAPVEGDSVPDSSLVTPAAPGTGATEEAPGEHPGSHHEPTGTPAGRNLDAEEM